MSHLLDRVKFRRAVGLLFLQLGEGHGATLSIGEAWWGMATAVWPSVK